MALFPCVVGDHRYAGPQQSAYCAALNGSFAARSKLRLCPEHLEELAQWLGDHLVLVAVGEKAVEMSIPANDGCYEDHPGDVQWHLFANVYRRGQPQLDFYGVSCTDHVEAFRTVTRLEL